MEKTKAICQKCNKEFEYELKPGYPRKYCFKCSEEVKAAYQAKQGDAHTDGQEQKSVESESYSLRDKMIISQCLTKAFADTKHKPQSCGDILDAFNYFMSEL